MVIGRNRSVDIVVAAGIVRFLDQSTAVSVARTHQRVDSHCTRGVVSGFVDALSKTYPFIDIALTDKRQDLDNPAMMVTRGQVADGSSGVHDARRQHGMSRCIVSEGDPQLQQVVHALRAASCFAH